MVEARRDSESDEGCNMSCSSDELHAQRPKLSVKIFEAKKITRKYLSSYSELFGDAWVQKSENYRQSSLIQKPLQEMDGQPGHRYTLSETSNNRNVVEDNNPNIVNFSIKFVGEFVPDKKGVHSNVQK